MEFEYRNPQGHLDAMDYDIQYQGKHRGVCNYKDSRYESVCVSLHMAENRLGGASPDVYRDIGVHDIDGCVVRGLFGPLSVRTKMIFKEDRMVARTGSHRNFDQCSSREA